MDRISAGGDGKRSRHENDETAWSELSPEILSAIGKRLYNQTDVCKFRSVCKNFRSSLPLLQNPTLFLPFQIPKHTPLPSIARNINICNVVPVTVFLVQPLKLSSNGWILSVAERKSGNFQLLHPLSRKPASLKDPTFPRSLNIAEFRVSEICKGCYPRVTTLSLASDSNLADFHKYGCKAVLCLNPEQMSPYSEIDNCIAFILYSNGTLISLSLKKGNWGYVRQSLVSPFKDVLWFNGIVYVVDDGGRLYVIDHITLHVTETVVDLRVCDDPNSMRLVELCNEVYLFVDVKMVYKLDQMQHKWDRRESLGGKVVFLGFDYCFMVSTQSLLSQGGDFVIFHQSILKNSYVNDSEFKEVPKDLGVYMYCLRGGSTEDSQLEVSYQAICNLLWPPPTWFWRDTFSSCSLQKASSSSKNAHKQLQSVKSHKPEASKQKFEGVDIRSDLVPTLQKIWEKHGNIVEGSSVLSKDIIACALESLAKVVAILQRSSGKSLTRSECDDMSSILLDLKQLHLSVEWLDPIVEKAMALHQNKLLVDDLAELDKSIAKNKEMKIKLTKELAKLEEAEQRREEDRMLVSEKISISGTGNLDQCIGHGLL